MRNSPDSRFVSALAVAATMLVSGTANAKEDAQLGLGGKPATSASAPTKTPLQLCLGEIALAVSSVELGRQSAAHESHDSCRSMGFQEAQAIKALKSAEEGPCNDPSAKTNEQVGLAFQRARLGLASLSKALDEFCPQEALVTECEWEISRVNERVTDGLSALYSGRGLPCQDSTGLHALAKSSLHLAKGACDSIDQAGRKIHPRASELAAKLEQATTRVKGMGATITGVCKPTGSARPIDTDE